MLQIALVKDALSLWEVCTDVQRLCLSLDKTSMFRRFWNPALDTKAVYPHSLYTACNMYASWHRYTHMG